MATPRLVFNHTLYFHPEAPPVPTPESRPSAAPAAGPLTVLLTTGGTIAGRQNAPGAGAADYQAGVLGAQALLDAVPALAGQPLQTVPVAQVDSKDMGPTEWQALVREAARQLARPEVAALVVTHGTDTLEETAWLLQRTLESAGKPVVLTAAMRPADALSADGPQNLLDAVTVAGWRGARGVLAVVAGQVFAARGLRKVDAWRLDAFDGERVAEVEAGRVRTYTPWPDAAPLAGARRAVEDTPVADWPTVAWVTSHGGFDARQVDALVGAGCRAMVVAGTGNATLHAALAAALQRARAAGVEVAVTTRCASARVVPGPAAADSGPGVGQASAGEGPWTPAQLRVELLLRRLVACRAVRPPSA